jgi:hypothetical protein
MLGRIGISNSPADGRFGLFEFKSTSEAIRLHTTATWPATETEKGAWFSGPFLIVLLFWPPSWQQTSCAASRSTWGAFNESSRPVVQ